LSRTKYYWYIYGGNDYTGFDFDYVPVPWESQYTHVWPTEWDKFYGAYLTRKDNASDNLYVHTEKLPTRYFPERVQVLINCDFDHTWTPHPWEPPYIYVFGNQHYPGTVMPTVKYLVPGATQEKFVYEPTATLAEDQSNWEVPDNIDTKTVDFTWRPDPTAPPYVYEFATQWNPEGGPVYRVPGATEYKYITESTVRTKPSRDNWRILESIYEDRFDWSWVPHPKDPPFIYVFGNQLYPAERMPTVEYHTPGAVERKFVDIIATLRPDPTNWIVPDTIDKTSVNYTWRPDPGDPAYIYEFATQWQPNGGAVYCVPGAVERKYVDLAHRRLPDLSNWTVPFPVENFDYSWHPDNTEEPYIYEFATQWQPNGGPTYCVPGAVKIKYVDIPAKRLPVNDPNWQTLEPCDFDYSWHPDTTEEPYIYIFGNQHYPGSIMPTVKYHMPGATQEKFIDLPVAKLAATRANWEILEPIDEDAWDWTWRPNPKDPPYIYQFGNQWNPAEYKASVRYSVAGATEVKYMELRTRRLPQPELFKSNIAVADFDWSWEPNPFDPPMTYVFGNQWNPAVLEPTVVYAVAGATEIKYVDDIVATVAKDMTAWELLDDIESFDYSWRPTPKDPAYIYVFGNQWLSPEQRPALRYTVPGATEIKYMDEPKARRVGDPSKFTTHYACDFDYSWEPDPGSPPYIYVFGNQWWPAEVMQTVEYCVAGATERKFMLEPVARLSERHNNHWHTLADCEFDYSWHPEPGSPAYIYVFGNQWYPAEVMPTVEYHMPGATERKYLDYNQAKLVPLMDRWSIPEEIDATNIDFSWHPHPQEQPYVHHFGTEHQMSIGLTYTVPGATELKFAVIPPLREKEKKVAVVLDIFFVDRNNATAQTRYERLQMRYPRIQKVRYANSIMATIQRCANKATTSKFWVISSEYNYDNFDFTWHAQPWQTYMTHVFPSQHQKWSDTFLINRWEFERHSAWAEGLEQFPNLNFVRDQTVTRPENLANIFYVDHSNGTIAQHQYEYLRTEHPDIVQTRFMDNYLDTFKRIMAVAETEYVWIINSVCDYTQFDFTWQPEPWQREMIHVFPSGLQKRGDTFYIHVESFKRQMIELELLDWFNVINYIDDRAVDRFSVPVHYYESDDLIAEIKNYRFDGPYVLFTNQKDTQIESSECLWSRKDRVVARCSESGATVLVPRDIKADLKSQIYDYPYIEDSVYRIRDYFINKHEPGLDIVYISNGEPDEQRWYDCLSYMSNTANIEWVRGVDGRTAAYQEAARRSRTPWFFAVFAKLEVLGSEFDWQWMPDYFQGPKHYIFNSRNPLNGLEYGHQGIIAYNKRMVLENNTPGIDFTLSQPHESVPILSGIAHFNQDPWMTWRTAFREVVKLKHFMATQPTVETEHRLKTWLTVAEGDYADDCLRGAEDAVKYYNEVGGDYERLKLSFEWAWLRQRFDNKY